MPPQRMLPMSGDNSPEEEIPNPFDLVGLEGDLLEIIGDPFDLDNDSLELIYSYFELIHNQLELIYDYFDLAYYRPFTLSYIYELEATISWDISISSEETLTMSDDDDTISDYDDSISTTDSEDSITTQEMEDADPGDQVRKLKGLVARLAKGFDAGSFPESVQDCIPQLTGHLFPGSYAHLLVILLMDFGMMEGVQMNLYEQLTKEFPQQLDHQAHAVTGLDGGLFVSELRVLRKLLAPLRGDNSGPIYWIGSRIEDPPETYSEVKETMEVIEKFKEDLLHDIQGPNDDREFVLSPLLPQLFPLPLPMLTRTRDYLRLPRQLH